MQSVFVTDTRTVQVQIKFRIELEEESLDKFVVSQERFKPCQFGYQVEHAEYVEYGTGPQRGREKYWIGKKGRKALDEWAEKKLGMGNKTERAKFVWFLAKKLGENGMSPQPYWRPALNSVMENMQTYYDWGFSLHDIGNEIHRISDNLLVQQGIPYQGDIQRNWHIEDITQEMAEKVNEPLDTLSLIEEQKWNKL